MFWNDRDFESNRMFMRLLLKKIYCRNFALQEVLEIQ